MEEGRIEDSALCPMQPCMERCVSPRRHLQQQQQHCCDNGVLPTSAVPTRIGEKKMSRQEEDEIRQARKRIRDISTNSSVHLPFIFF